MAVREILLYPKDKDALRERSEPVCTLNRQTRHLIKDLKDTLLAHPDGIGLAAPQINVHQRVVLVQLGGRSDASSEPGPPMALVNPEIAEASDECADFDGCLSFPGLFGETVRPHFLRVSGLDERGHPFDRIYEGFDAVVVHHELDHLEGVLFIDRIRSFDDLYRIYFDDRGNPVRVSMSLIMHKREGVNRILQNIE